jgi:hypothetical protein
MLQQNIWQTKAIPAFLIIGLLLSLSCQTGSNRVIIQELGFSMSLPKGWLTDSREPSTFYEKSKRDDNWGMVVEYQLEEGETMEEFVENTLKESEEMETMYKKMAKTLGRIAGEEELGEEISETRIVAKTPCKVSNLNAIEVVKEAEYTVLEVYIDKGDKVIEVFFRALPEDFPKYEPSFRQAIESIKIQ